MLIAAVFLTLAVKLFIFYLSCPEMPYNELEGGDSYIKMGELWIENGQHAWVLHPPLYPYIAKNFILAFGHNAVVVAMVVLQGLLSTGIVVIGYLIAKQMTSNRQAQQVASTAAVLIALNPLINIYSFEIRTEIVYTFLLASSLIATVYLLIKTDIKFKNLFLLASVIGTSLGLAHLTRSTGYIIAAAAVIIIFFNSKSSLIKRFSAVLIIIFFYNLVLFPWNLHMYHRYGVYKSSNTDDYNFAALLIANAKGMKEGTGSGHDYRRWKEQLIAASVYYPSNDNSFLTYEEYGGRFADTAKMRNIALKWAFENPLSVAKAIEQGLVTELVGPGASSWERIAKTRNTTPLAAWRILVLLFSIFGIYAYWKQSKGQPQYRCVFFLLLAVVLIHVGIGSFSGYSRRVVPILPYLDIFCAFGLICLAKLLKNNKIANSRHSEPKRQN